MSVNYSTYLKLDALLDLQKPLSDGPEHDETLFIIIHQVYELWFKQVLHEVDHLQGLFDADNSPLAAHTLKRILTIFKTLVGQLDILETLTPTGFLSFRERLDSASGFQSAQFRELEFALGHKRPELLNRFPEGSTARNRLKARIRQRSLWQSFLLFLGRQGHDLPAAALERDASLPTEASLDVQRVILDIHRNNPSLTNLCELLVDLDEGLQEWRYRHVKMVERTIGSRSGTGGSAGADYLKKTLFDPLFPDLWAIRDEL